MITLAHTQPRLTLTHLTGQARLSLIAIVLAYAAHHTVSGLKRFGQGLMWFCIGWYLTVEYIRRDLEKLFRIIIWPPIGRHQPVFS